MINANMHYYNYFTFGEPDEYGQKTLIKGADGKPQAQGTIKIAINTTSQTIQDNINYKGATYIGLTHAKVDDTYVIEYGEERLKVLYINAHGRYNQVFMVNI